jgi:hypothetical protein
MAFERGRALRAEIRAMLLAHPPTAAPLTGKHILPRLKHSPRPSLRTVQWHLHAIRSEHDWLQRAQFNLSSA